MSFNNFDIFLMIGIAVVATILRLYDFPMPPLILAFVLGGLMEENLRRSLLISDGSWAFLWDRPLNSLYNACYCRNYWMARFIIVYLKKNYNLTYFFFLSTDQSLVPFATINKNPPANPKFLRNAIVCI